MYKHIYDIFKRWYNDDRGQILFYSDPHFDDLELSKYRNITSEEQVNRINSKVGKYDTIIFLGDIGNPEYINKIRGYKVLIMGNHDSGASNYTNYFDEIYEGPIIISDKIILSHEPIELPFLFNIHGHCHGFDSRAGIKNELNVCAESINYSPVRLNDIIKSGVLKAVDSIHRSTIDRATKRKDKRRADGQNNN